MSGLVRSSVLEPVITREGLYVKSYLKLEKLAPSATFMLNTSFDDAGFQKSPSVALKICKLIKGPSRHVNPVVAVSTPRCFGMFVKGFDGVERCASR